MSDMVDFLQLPKGANNYVSKVLDLCVTIGRDWEFKALVKAWMAKEVQAQYKAPSKGLKLKSSGCPAAVADWIKNACSPHFHPSHWNTDQYADQFAAWWQALQLDSRD